MQLWDKAGGCVIRTLKYFILPCSFIDDKAATLPHVFAREDGRVRAELLLWDVRWCWEAGLEMHSVPWL